MITIQRRAPVESPASLRIATKLDECAGAGADATQVAGAIVAIWRDIDIVLAPILGQHGVTTLYKRSLYLARATHPWLAGTHEGLLKTMELAPLQSALLQQDSASAAAAGRNLLLTFHELLTSLIGPSLTEQLLGSVWANSSSGAPAQDTTSR